ALDVQIAEKRFVPAGERKPGHRRRYADVDSNHPGVEVARELPRGPATAGENAGAIAKFALPAKSQRLVEIIHADDRKYRAKNLFAGQPHPRLHSIDDARPEQKAFSRQVKRSAVERHLGSLALRHVQI